MPVSEDLILYSAVSLRPIYTATTCNALGPVLTHMASTETANIPPTLASHYGFTYYETVLGAARRGLATLPGHEASRVACAP